MQLCTVLKLYACPKIAVGYVETSYKWEKTANFFRPTSSTTRHLPNEPICRTCPHIIQSTSLSSPGGQIKITGHFNCTSDNIIYCISCRKCPRPIYIGETGRRLIDLFREHRFDVVRKKSDLPVAQHLNNPGHSLEDVRAAVLKSGLGKKDVRQREEMKQIFIFQTLAPGGINRDFSFLSLDTRARNFWNAQTNQLVILRGS